MAPHPSIIPGYVQSAPVSRRPRSARLQRPPPLPPPAPHRHARGLASRGYTVLEAGNGVEAIDVLEKADGQIDLVVSDVVMPEMDGPTLLRELRNRNPSLKIIFVSGYAEDAFQKHLPEHGQFAFLPKPFTLTQLVAAVKDTLAA